MNAKNTVTYRYGNEADLPRIKEMIAAGDLDARDVIPQNVLLAEAEGIIVGINRVKYHPDGAAEIASAYVIHEYRGRRINEKLTRLLMEAASTKLYIITNPQNADYVKKMGFLDVRPIDGIPLSIQEKAEWCRVHYNVPDPGPSVLFYHPSER